MNLKKALQAFLVTISCGMLNVAGAQQRPVFIPEDYVTEQAQADFVANGPKLLFSTVRKLFIVTVYFIVIRLRVMCAYSCIMSMVLLVRKSWR